MVTCDLLTCSALAHSMDHGAEGGQTRGVGPSRQSGSRNYARHDAREAASLTRVKHQQLGNALVGAAEPPTKLTVDILHHHHIRIDVGLVARVEFSGRELVQHGWAFRDDGG